MLPIDYQEEKTWWSPSVPRFDYEVEKTWWPPNPFRFQEDKKKEPGGYQVPKIYEFSQIEL